LFWLRSGHNKLNHFISRLEPETLADCPNGCPEREDATHVLLHCQHYTEARSEMERNLSPLKIPLGLPTSFFIRICFL
jgi:hypothetical protein